jgi:DNA-binding MarR family transcriptional regulator
MSAEHERLARHAWIGLRGAFDTHVEATKAGIQDMGMSPVMVQTLKLLMELPTGAMSQLVDRLAVDPAWVTAVVDRLEARGDVVRVPSQVDRRVKLLEVTDSGRRTWRRLQRLLATPPNQLRQLSREELAALVRIGEHLATIAAHPPASARVKGRPRSQPVRQLRS